MLNECSIKETVGRSWLLCYCCQYNYYRLIMGDYGAHTEISCSDLSWSVCCVVVITVRQGLLAV